MPFFISRWKASGASERANYQLFITELCELLDVEKPRPSSDKVHEAIYAFERPVEFDDGEGKRTTNFIDLYKRNCFVLEAKQGVDKARESEAEILGGDKVKSKSGTATRDTRAWEREMKRAKEQALRYARSLPTSEGWPPFLVVVDVGYCIDIYSDFSRQGKTYVPFPGPLSYRILLSDLENSEIRKRLSLLFTEPLKLDPSKRAAKVTRELAERLAKLAALLEQSGHSPEKVAGFLMRCLFTIFAEDVRLLPERSFTKLLQDYKNELELLPQALQSLWISMDKGGFEPALRISIPQFNGFLFKEQEALQLTEAQLDLLILASEADWSDVEPAIFGTLLERALQPRERHKLGAHYTPREYVERLVMPTVIEPLREEWEAARTASAIFEKNGDDSGALKEIMKFQRRLCSVKVLDPACGSGNFLYVTLEHLKRLEGEVIEYIAHFPRQLGLDMSGGYTVTPAQLLGIEVNPRAAAIADVVLWIGYLQWHFRTHGHAKRLENPILRQYGNIVQQDAILSYKSMIPRLDIDGQVITRWDGHTTKQHNVTGIEVPDETARTLVYDYIDPTPATWPIADFDIGNPPFIGDKAMRATLGDGYVDALRKAYKGIVPESADYVMFWWQKAAELVRKNKVERFGFITTNSLKQTFNRRVIQSQLDATEPLSIIYAIPDHPWVDTANGAAVEIAMTVGAAGKQSGRYLTIVRQEILNGEKILTFQESIANIHADLTIGADVATSIQLKSNHGISSLGMMLAGSGFIVTPEKARHLGLGSKPELDERIRPYRNGKDLTATPRGVMLIDMFPLSEKDVRSKFPEVYQHLIDTVKPERDQNNRKSISEKWWLFAECRQGLRASLKGLNRYISTPETAKHRFFVFNDISILPDHMLISFAFEDAYFLGILSSKIHVIWALATGGDLGGNTPRYNKSRCFDTFPFPVASDDLKERIRNIANKLDSHRRQRQALYPNLTITDMYNVLEKLRNGEILNSNEQKIHEHGLVGILLQLHIELDIAVSDSYGWHKDLADEEILLKLATLNKLRAAEEERGVIKWLRPEYQNKQSSQQTGLEMTVSEVEVNKDISELADWPKSLSEQAKIVHRVVQQSQNPVSATNVNMQFRKVQNAASISREKQIREILDAISALGLVRRTTDGLFIR